MLSDQNCTEREMSEMQEVEANASVAKTTPQVDAGVETTTQTTEESKVDSKEEPATEPLTTSQPESSKILKTTASAGRNPRNNNKFDPSSLPASTDGDEIRRQVGDVSGWVMLR